MHNFTIKSHLGSYEVEFDNDLLNNNRITDLGTHYIIDKNVLDALGNNFLNNYKNKICIVIEATEERKSYSGIEPIIAALIDQGLKRDGHLVAIGGGITQDITCFIANNFMRGIKWTFIPTTLLSQADSCIGSKSSINFQNTKNILGSFTPPNRVIISNQFLQTLAEKEIDSGIGEIIKLYLIDGKIVDKDTIKQDLTQHLYNTLQIKKEFIELDEFDKGPRNILNYGHCFGHAIESATNFGIPHGIAVTIGMELANQLALEKELIDQQYYSLVRSTLESNYQDWIDYPIPRDVFFSALSKDKKNTSSTINIVLPVNGKITKFGFENNNTTLDLFKAVLSKSKFKFVAE